VELCGITQLAKIMFIDKRGYKIKGLNLKFAHLISSLLLFLIVTSIYASINTINGQVTQALPYKPGDYLIYECRAFITFNFSNYCNMKLKISVIITDIEYPWVRFNITMSDPEIDGQCHPDVQKYAEMYLPTTEMGRARVDVGPETAFIRGLPMLFVDPSYTGEYRYSSPLYVVGAILNITIVFNYVSGVLINMFVRTEFTNITTNFISTIIVELINTSIQGLPRPSPIQGCVILGAIITSNETKINKNTYPMLKLTLKTLGNCGDNIKVVKTNPDRDPMNKHPVLTCNYIGRTTSNGVNNDMYQCIASWNYVAETNELKTVLEVIIKLFLATLPDIAKLLDNINKIFIELLSKNAILLNVTYTIQLDNSNIFDLTVSAPSSKVHAIQVYITLRILRLASTIVSVIFTGICILGSIATKGVLAIICAPKVATLTTALSIALTTHERVAQLVAFDPTNEEYYVITEVPEPSEKIRDLARKYGNIIYDLYYYVAYVNASMISIEKAFTANEMGDYGWYLRQLAIAKEYSGKASVYFEKIRDYLKEALKDIDITINETIFYQGLSYLEEYGLPSDTIEILEALGLLDFAEFKENIEALKTIGYVEVNITELLDKVPSPSQVISKYIELLQNETLHPTPTKPLVPVGGSRGGGSQYQISTSTASTTTTPSLIWVMVELIVIIISIESVIVIYLLKTRRHH
jgi:hypothetical protein